MRGRRGISFHSISFPTSPLGGPLKNGEPSKAVPMLIRRPHTERPHMGMCGMLRAVIAGAVRAGTGFFFSVILRQPNATALPAATAAAADRSDI